MELEKEYSCLERNGIVYHKTIDCDEDYQETIQQYCDDLFRIIKVDSICSLNSVRFDNGCLQIDCKISTSLTYQNELNELCYADFENQIVKKINIDNISESAFVRVLPQEKYTNYRIVNQRRIDFHISFCLDITVFDKLSCPCISSCNNSRLRNQSIKMANIFNAGISKLDFDEEFSVSSSSSSIKRVISRSYTVNVKECKIIKDKALIKLDVSLCVMYSTDEKNECIEKTEHTFSLNKIIDSSGIDENDIIISNVYISNLYIKAKSSSHDALNVIEAYGDISISSLFIKEFDASIITDGYVLGKKTECKYNPYEYISCGELLNTYHKDRAVFSFNTSIKNVYDFSIKVANVSCYANKINIKLCSNAIIVDEDNCICSVSSEYDMSVDCKYNKAFVSAFINSFDYNIENENKICANVSIKIDAYLYNESTANVLCEIEALDTVVEYPALTVYFGRQSDSVWDIAKRFSSDANTIMIENELSSEILSTNKLLIIPSV